jgi:hypothetical protein
MVLFALGVAFGEALHDEPASDTVTSVRTLHPVTVAPPPRTTTVTVTTGG